MAAGEVPRITTSTRRALGVTVVYGVVGAAWIGYSDTFVANLDLDLATLTRMQQYKGWGYVLVTAILLFLALRYLFARLERSHQRLAAKHARLMRINRVYHMIRAIKSALLRMQESDALLQETCRVAVVQGGYHIAWLGLESPDGHYLRTAAHAGAGQALFEDLLVRLDAADESPILQAHRSAQASFQRCARDPVPGDTGETAARLGYQAVAALPLRIDGVSIGILALYATQADAFDDREECALLREVADNLALGLGYLRRGRELETLNLYDPTTGLANRRLFEQRVTQALARAQRRKQAVAVAILDIDDFRSINHGGGRATGDQALRAVGQIVGGLMRPGDTVARMGNDEFAVLLVDLPTSSEASIPIGRIADAVAQQLDLDGHTVYLSVSVGAAVYPDDGGDADEMIARAELALHSQPRERRSTVSYYGCALNFEAEQRRRIDLALRASLGSAEFSLAWQPIQTLDGHVMGVEALLRWQHPELGAISPATFIPVAEQTGLIVQLGEYVLRTACAQADAWSRARAGVLQVAVNVAVQQLRHPDFASLIEEMLSTHGNPHWQLVLEITESEFALETESMTNTCAHLRALGCAIHIDDFGTGYSALSYLTRLPANALKIDRSFVVGAEQDECARAIIDAVVTLGKRLDLQIIAEGVETRQQHDLMSRLGCDAIQGFLIGHPQTAEAFHRNHLVQSARPDT